MRATEAGGDGKARMGRAGDRDGDNGGAGKDGGREMEDHDAMGVGRTTEVGSCGDAAENGRDTESTGNGGRRQRQRSRDGCGTKCPKEKENGQ